MFRPIAKAMRWLNLCDYVLAYNKAQTKTIDMINTAKEIVSTVKFTTKNMCPR